MVYAQLPKKHFNNLAKNSTLQLDSIYTYDKDMNSGILELGWRFIPIYDKNDKVVQILTDFKQHNGLPKWFNFKKDIYDYTGNGLLAKQDQYSWNIWNLMYDYNNKLALEYDSNNRKIGENLYQVFTDSNYFVEKLTLTYDSNGNNSMIACKRWNDKFDTFIDFYKEEFAFKKVGLIDSAIRYNNNDSLTVWNYESKAKYFYDGREKLNMKINYSWQIATGSWIDSLKTEYTYDSLGNNILEVQWRFDTLQQVWQPFRKALFTYNTATRAIDDYRWPDEMIWSSIFPLFNHKEYNYNLTEALQQNYENNTWVNLVRHTYYYSIKNVTGIDKVTAFKDARTYPNPTTGILKLMAEGCHPEKVVVYNMFGEIVLLPDLKIGIEESEIDLSDLCNGMYLVVVTYKDGTITKGKVLLGK
jgi:hypothetical protein